MKAVIYKGANTIAVEEVDMPTVGENEALIKVEYAGICGGDLGIYKGTHPRAKAPLVMGHELSGTLMNDTKHHKKGTKVTVNPIISCGECILCKNGNSHVCNTLRLIGIDYNGGMGEYTVVHEDKVVAVPDDMSFESAAVVEPVAVAVHSVRETGYRAGDNAVVFGCGTIGLVTGLVLKEFGCTNITMVETDEKRIEFAKNLGFDVVEATGLDINELKLQKTQGYGFDWVFDCAGADAVAMQLIEICRVKGKIVVVAGYKKPTLFPVNQGMFKEVAIEFVRVYRENEFKIAVELVKKQPLFSKIVTNILPVEQAQEGFDLLFTKGTGAIKVLFKLS